MKLYFSNSQIPELAGLTRDQRRAVYECALEAFFLEKPSRVWFGVPWILGGLLGGLLGGMMVAGTGLSRLKLPVIAGCAIVGAAIAIFLGAQFHVAQLRPYLRRVLEERQNEIAQIK